MFETRNLVMVRNHTLYIPVLPNDFAGNRGNAKGKITQTSMAPLIIVSSSDLFFGMITSTNSPKDSPDSPLHVRTFLVK